MKINGTGSVSRMLHKPFIALSLITACVMTVANAQEANNGKPAQQAALAPKVINIWPGVAPGSEQWKQQESHAWFRPDAENRQRDYTNPDSLPARSGQGDGHRGHYRSWRRLSSSSARIPTKSRSGSRPEALRDSS